MDYVFGTKGSFEVLKTKGTEHTDFTGYHSVERKYPDQTITDNFRIVRKINSTEDVEGNCYDWYEIDSHYRITDKTEPIVDQMNQNKTELENALCEQDAVVDERLAAIEDALCEMDKL